MWSMEVPFVIVRELGTELFVRNQFEWQILAFSFVRMEEFVSLQTTPCPCAIAWESGKEGNVMSHPVVLKHVVLVN